MYVLRVHVFRAMDPDHVPSHTAVGAYTHRAISLLHICLYTQQCAESRGRSGDTRAGPADIAVLLSNSLDC